jgi:hypothetical protein
MRFFLVLSILLIASCSWFNKEPLAPQANVTTAPAVKANDTESVCMDAFEKTISDLNSNGNFQALYDFYKNHSNCMDGAYSQGIEGAISLNLDVFWKNLDSLKKLFDADKEFKNFFFASMGCYVSATEKHLANVIVKTQNECPSSLKDLCGELKAKAEKEIAYAKSQ